MSYCAKFARASKDLLYLFFKPLDMKRVSICLLFFIYLIMRPFFVYTEIFIVLFLHFFIIDCCQLLISSYFIFWVIAFFVHVWIFIFIVLLIAVTLPFLKQALNLNHEEQNFRVQKIFAYFNFYHL